MDRTQAETRIFGLCALESALRPRFPGLAHARDRSSLHVVRKENNGRKAWFRHSTISFSPFSCSSSLPAGLMTLAACPAAPAAHARACVPEVPARLSPASAGLGRAGPLSRWPWPRPCPRPRPPASASAFAYGLGLGLALGLDPRLGLGLRPRPRPASCAHVTGWFPAGGCRAWPAGSALLADTSRHFSPSLFGSNASQAAELSLLGFRVGLAWLIEPYQAPPGPASP